MRCAFNFCAIFVFCRHCSSAIHLPLLSIAAVSCFQRSESVWVLVVWQLDSSGRTSVWVWTKCQHVTRELTKGKSICCRFGFYGRRNEGYKVHYLIYTYLLFVSYYLLFCSPFSFVSLLNSHFLALLVFSTPNIFIWCHGVCCRSTCICMYDFFNGLFIPTHSLYYIAFLLWHIWMASEQFRFFNDCCCYIFAIFRLISMHFAHLTVHMNVKPPA